MHLAVWPDGSDARMPAENPCHAANEILRDPSWQA